MNMDNPQLGIPLWCSNIGENAHVTLADAVAVELTIINY